MSTHAPENTQEDSHKTTATVSTVRVAWDHFFANRISRLMARGTLSSIVVACSTHLLNFGLMYMIAQAMNDSQYGIYMYVVTWLGVLQLLATAGFDRLLLRFVPTYMATEELGKLRGAIQRGVMVCLVTSTMVSASLAIAVSLFLDETQIDLQRAWYVCCLALPLLTLLSVAVGILSGVKQVFRSQLVERLVRPACMLIPVCLWYFAAGETMFGHHGMWMFLAGTACSLVLALVFCFRSLKRILGDVQPEFETRNWLKTSIPLLLVSGTFLLINQTDSLMIGAILGTDEVGPYATASRLATLVIFGMLSVQSMAAPLIAECYTKKQTSELQRVLFLTSRVATVFAIPVAIAFAILGDDLLRTFNATFDRAHVSLILLSVAQTLNAFTGATGLTMTMTGRQGMVAKVIGSCVILNALLNMLMIPWMGITGAAVATCISSVTWNVFIVIYIRKTMRLNTLPF